MSGREHGTHVCYVHGPDRAFTGRGCRCEPCRAANAAYEKERKRRAAPAYVAASSARAHVRDLMAAGLGLKTIAKRAGVSNGALSKLMYGDYGRGTPPSKRIRPETRDRILAVMPNEQADGALVDAARTWERIDALVAKGWTKTAIARALGQSGPGLQVSRSKVEAATERKVAALADLPVPPRRGRWGIVEPVPEPEPHADQVAGEADAEIDRYQLPALQVAGDTAWMRTAPCRRPEVPTWLFFPERGDNETVERAKAVCRTCPHQAPCLEVALANGEAGVWGGTSAAERRGMRRLDRAS